MKTIFERPKSLLNKPFTYCPGCLHGLAHRLIAEVIDELGLAGSTVGVGPVGCSVYICEFIDVDFVMGPHGRAPALATGVKRSLPDHLVFSYQGDGDIAAIGTAEIVHAAARGELISAFFVNNAIFGMTGGQMAPTTITGQRTTTSPAGRNSGRAGYPIRLCEMLGELEGSSYLARVSLTRPNLIRQARQAVRRAFDTQLQKKGFSLVEFLSPCPTNWKMTPAEAVDWVENTMTRHYPLGIIKDWNGGTGGR